MSRQRSDVEGFVEAVAATGHLDAEQRRVAVVQRIRTLVPNERLSILAELGIEPVLASLDGAAGRAHPP